MEWNNGKERAKFEREQEELRAQYLAAGMTEEQIQIMYNYDLDYLNLLQREAHHTQEIDVEVFDDDGDIEAKSPMFKKFLSKLSIEDQYFDNRLNWIEQIESMSLYQAITKLSNEDKEILTMLFFDGMKQVEICNLLGMKKAALSRKIGRLKKYLKNFL